MRGASEAGFSFFAVDDSPRLGFRGLGFRV